MRYGNPSIRSRLEALAAQDCERILMVPLYPQYAAATTATVCDEVFRGTAPHAIPADVACRRAVLMPSRSISMRLRPRSMRQLAKLSFKPDVIIASYHGMPEDYVAKGDPYLKQCGETTRAAAQKAQAR